MRQNIGNETAKQLHLRNCLHQRILNELNLNEIKQIREISNSQENSTQILENKNKF